MNLTNLLRELDVDDEEDAAQIIASRIDHAIIPRSVFELLPLIEEYLAARDEFIESNWPRQSLGYVELEGRLCEIGKWLVKCLVLPGVPGRDEAIAGAVVKGKMRKKPL